LSATALAAGTAASFLLARVITRPLSRLRRAAGELAAGRWGHRVAMHGHDEIARLGQAFDRMAEDLQQLDRTRRDFVADASHELRTPLAAMRALAEPMAHGQPLPGETYRELAKDLLAQVERLQRLSEGLLELARLENQLETGAPLHRTPTDLTEVAREAIDQIVPVAEQRGIQIFLDLPPRLPATVDPEAIVRVLTNLLHNAVKYTPAGGRVSLSMRGHGDRVKLQVSDTGEGIPPDQIPLLFQRFHRVDRARARHTGGTGLGLAIADRLVRLHGGEITVESTPGQGSTFTVWIPYS
ncbi:MAG TPA: HAMP domain-containing protein, partial [Firmicutes bacterium]|nr:HAMP domain-containing protein [Bacillota bacterium]